MTLRGLKQQYGILDALAADARAGRSRRLVAYGNPGIAEITSSCSYLRAD